MRILANFSKKVSTGNYENESFSVTIECETEFNDVAEVADYLFQEAQAAIGRQIGEGNSSPKPATKLPKVLQGKGGDRSANIQKSGSNGNNGKKPENSGNGKNGNALMTDAQRRFLFKLLAEQGVDEEQAHEVLKDSFGIKTLKDATKSQASELINHLMQNKEKVSA